MIYFVKHISCKFSCYSMNNNVINEIRAADRGLDQFDLSYELLLKLHCSTPSVIMYRYMIGKFTGKRNISYKYL